MERHRSELTMRLFINSLAASAGGGLTYIRNVLPQMAAIPGLQITVAVAPNLQKEFEGASNIEFIELQISGIRRFWQEQVALKELIRRSRSDILLSTGNFALMGSPVPQILLSRNSIYTSADFYSDLLSRHEYRMWLDSRIRAVLARKSIRWADLTVAPSESFAAELRSWTNTKVLAVHHGFDRVAFTRDSQPLNAEVEQQLRNAEPCFKLLFVSHYNYYRNFETLIRALPLLRDGLGPRRFKLLLTCKLSAGQNPGAYRPELAVHLGKKLGVSDLVVELGAIPYRQLHHLYRRADAYVSPAYTETFAHPLVEAMSSRLPVVASDLPVHREICGDAAVYFPPFSETDLAECILRLVNSTEAAERMAILGEERSIQFSWKTHVEEIVRLAETLIGKG
jgi:glycosyltransferase involved in cell wall biosynthesis